MSATDLRTDQRIARTKADLLSPADRAELEATYGKLIGPLIDAKLETKARELLDRYQERQLALIRAVVGDTSNRDQLLVSRDEAAEMLGVSLSTVKRMEEGGELPEPIKFNERIVRHRIVDIERLARTRVAVACEG